MTRITPLPWAFHQWHGGLRQQECPLQVDVDRPIPVLFREQLDRLDDAWHARVRVEDFDSAVGGDGGDDHPLRIGRLRHVAGDRDGLLAPRPNAGGDALGGLADDIRDDDPGALFGEQLGRRLADSRTRARDERDLVLQPIHRFISNRC
ncbi:MAG TPA: hypothetical protein VIM30_13875 [Candidatus Limnocylindrales bacterium]